MPKSISGENLPWATCKRLRPSWGVNLQVRGLTTQVILNKYLFRTEYESECWTKQEEHNVQVECFNSHIWAQCMQDDVVECRTEVEEKCEPNTSGYTTTIQCSKWPREVCRFNLNKEMLTNRNSMLRVSKKSVKKYTPITGCTKEPREICAPAGCGFKKVFDKKPFYFCFTSTLYTRAHWSAMTKFRLWCRMLLENNAA